MYIELYVTTQQERELAAMADFYLDELDTLTEIDDSTPAAVTTRHYGPFDADTLAWIKAGGAHKAANGQPIAGIDATGREYLEI